MLFFRSERKTTIVLETTITCFLSLVAPLYESKHHVSIVILKQPSSITFPAIDCIPCHWLYSLPLIVFPSVDCIPRHDHVTESEVGQRKDCPVVWIFVQQRGKLDCLVQWKVTIKIDQPMELLSNKPDYWEEFFLLKVSCCLSFQLLISILSQPNCSNLQSLVRDYVKKENKSVKKSQTINLLFSQCIAAVKDENQIRIANALLVSSWHHDDDLLILYFHW